MPRRPGLRLLVAWAPWLAFAVAVTDMALWWTQRPWAMRLAGCGMLAAWLLAWNWRAFRADRDTRFRAPLTWVAAAAMALGLQGAVFGLATVPVVLSAWLASAGALLFAVAASGAPLARAKALAAAVSALLALAALEAGTRGLGIGETARESDSIEIARRFNNLTPPRSAFLQQAQAPRRICAGEHRDQFHRHQGPGNPDRHGEPPAAGRQLHRSAPTPSRRGSTLGPRLQATLGARSSDARVVSHGMRGWSPLLAWNWYLKVGRRFHAERVLLFFFWNNLWAAGTEAQTFRAVFGPDGRPDHFDVLLDSGWNLVPARSAPSASSRRWCGSSTRAP